LDCIIIIDKHGIIQEINKAAIDTFGYSKEEIKGLNVNILMP